MTYSKASIQYSTCVHILSFGVTVRTVREIFLIQTQNPTGKKVSKLTNLGLFVDVDFALGLLVEPGPLADVVDP